ncbi:MAG: NAD-dependent epimerase/dehydratase family protein [Bacillaceae bacterium]|nr:NAD-dependent epimerase/dehydratase family protein [Bacillaceae bacterium]
MNIIVTGAAGFIGSSLCENLLETPTNKIIGIDAFVGPTPKKYSLKNLSAIINHPRFTFIDQNLLSINWKEYLPNIDYIFHLAGMPGVRSSWGKNFEEYSSYNILATQKLLDAAIDFPIKKLIFASTSSVYGDRNDKVSEDTNPKPLSPYGITKLTAEHLCHVYRENFQVPIVILRYFTVFGPRQRSDMAFHRFILAMLTGRPISIFGDGSQSRDFTFIEDCVNATASVITAKNVIGETINIGGSERQSIKEVVHFLEDILNQEAKINFTNQAVGEPKQTWADISKAEVLLNYKPQTDIKAGLVKQVEYLKYLYSI